MLKRVSCIFFLFFVAKLLVGQPVKPEAAAPIEIHRGSNDIKIDGSLNEPDWREATVMSDFMQSLPTAGSQPTFKTVVRLFYTDEYFYIGVECFDSIPEKVQAFTLERDKWIPNDDGVGIVLDTWNDKSHAILLFANSAGNRRDVELIGNDGNINGSFNTFWDVSSSKTSQGYILEYRIPFSSLRFQAKDVVEMGLRVLRQMGRNNEFEIFPRCDVNVSNITWRVNTSQPILFRNLRASKPIYFSPYVAANYAESVKLNAATNSYEKTTEFIKRKNYLTNPTADKVLSNIGADLKYGVTKNFTLDLTLNNDFAQVEVDNRVLNVSRFAVNLPEKRNFFLEANDFFSYTIVPDNMILFNSRNIGIEKGLNVPVVAGVRLHGKANGLQVGVLDIQTSAVAEAGINSQNFSVVRLRKDLYKNGSYAGVFLSNRVSTDSKSLSNQVMAFDMFRRINNKWTWSMGLGSSRDTGQKIFGSKNKFLTATLSKDVTTGLSLFGIYNYIQQDFNPATGFIYDQGFHEFFTNNTYTIRTGSKGGVNFVDFSLSAWLKWRDLVNYRYHEYSEIGPQVKVRFINGGYVFAFVTTIRDSVRIPWNLPDGHQIKGKLYFMKNYGVSFSSATTKKIQLQSDLRFGGFYSGTKYGMTTTVSFSASRKLNLGLTYAYNTIKFDEEVSGAKDYVSHLGSLQAGYYFSIKSSFKLFMQYDNISNTVGCNLRFRYNPHEGTDLYIAYTPVLNTDMLELPRRPLFNSQLVNIKYVRTFNLGK
jgi:hypothetical protein